MNYYYMYVIVLLSVIIILTFLLDMYIRFVTQKDSLEWMVEEKNGTYYVWKTKTPYDWNGWILTGLGLVGILYFIYNYAYEFISDADIKRLESSLPASPTRSMTESPLNIETRLKLLNREKIII